MIHPAPQRVLIVKLSSLGDIIHALPTAAALRAAHPEVRLAWAVERKWLPLVEHHPSLDEVFVVDSFSLRRRPDRWHQFRDDLRRLRAFVPDCALDLQGTVKSALLTRASGAPIRVGFAHSDVRESLSGIFYTLRVQPRSAHMVEQLLDLAEVLGPLPREIGFALPIPDAVQQSVDGWIASSHMGAFAFFSPGGGWASKRWPSERYAELAVLLESQFDLHVVLNRGPGDQAMDEAYRRANEIRARLFSGDVLHLAAVLKRARVVIGGDTGPMQLAAALGVPTIALFGPTDPARNRPYSAHGVVLRKPTATSYRRRNSYSPSMLAIAPAEVAEACGKLLGAGATATPEAGRRA